MIADNIAPPEVQQQLWDLLKWRDGVYRQVLAQLSLIPGLSELIDSLTDALNACKSFRLNFAQGTVSSLDTDVYTLLAVSTER